MMLDASGPRHEHRTMIQQFRTVLICGIVVCLTAPAPALTAQQPRLSPAALSLIHI